MCSSAATKLTAWRDSRGGFRNEDRPGIVSNPDAWRGGPGAAAMAIGQVAAEEGVKESTTSLYDDCQSSGCILWDTDLARCHEPRLRHRGAGYRLRNSPTEGRDGTMSQRRHARSDTGVVRARRLTVPVLHGALDFVILSAVIRLVTAGIQGLFDALAVGQLVASLLAGAVLAIGAETCVAVRRDRRQGLILAWIIRD